jgi:energy-coupling factor transporter ATP-binding protein EcfA2
MIREIKIENFRSIRELTVNDVTKFFSIAGPNGTGKSNVLRALNAFFNNETEPDQRLDLDRDFHKAAEKRRQKREIRVSCRFLLPPEFNFHSKISQAVKDLGLDGRDFRIRRTWGLDWSARRADHLQYSVGHADFLSVTPVQRGTLELFLNRLIRFRYLSNHLHPLTLVRGEASRLQQVLLSKIRRSRDLSSKVNPEAQLNPTVLLLSLIFIPPPAKDTGR